LHGDILYALNLNGGRVRPENHARKAFSSEDTSWTCSAASVVYLGKSDLLGSSERQELGPVTSILGFRLGMSCRQGYTNRRFWLAYGLVPR
jgi:hypothetical protein